MVHKKADDQPHAVDVYVGSRVRLRRLQLGISQEKLGDAVGVTFQQVQKYERGANRISASRLFEFAGALDVPVCYFFEGLDVEAAPAGDRDRIVEFINSHEGVSLAAAWSQVTEPTTRRQLLELVREIARARP